MRVLSLKFILYACSILATQVGCATSIKANNPYILRLKNRGPVPLSADNPYLAANALLIKEMKESADLKGFLEHRARPAAIEVHQHTFFPLNIDLFYVDKGEYYTLEEIDNSWVINGPYEIDSAKLKQLKPVTIFSKDNPFTINKDSPKDTQTEPTPPTSAQKTLRPRVSATVEPPATIKKKIVDESEQISVVATPLAQPIPSLKNDEVKQPIEEPSSEKSLTRLAAEYGESSAELTPKGDLVHYVVSPGETLAMLARWYTFDVSSKKQLARINTIADESELSVGDSVVIPKYMLKNTKRLNDAALAALETAVARGEIK